MGGTLFSLCWKKPSARRKNHKDYRLNGPTARSNRTVKTVGQTTIRFTVVITGELPTVSY